MIDVCESPSFFTTKYHYEFKRFFFICISHILYCKTVYFSYNLGKSHGASDIVSDMIDRKLFTNHKIEK